MKKLKDFIYNWNDILIILFILTVAGLLICWRLGVIMDYPKAIAPTVTASSSGNNNTSGSTATDKPNPNAADSVGQDNQGENVDRPASYDHSAPPGSGPSDSTIWNNGKLKVNITVEVAEGSAVGAADSLVQAGLFISYEDYSAVCEAAGVEPTSILATTYTFEAGSTQTDIVTKVTSM